MTRFWITLESGVKFVIRCLEEMHGGEIFVPKIPSMRMMDLAECIAPGCEIETIGNPARAKNSTKRWLSEDEARNTVEVKDMYVISPHTPGGRGSTG